MSLKVRQEPLVLKKLWFWGSHLQFGQNWGVWFESLQLSWGLITDFTGHKRFLTVLKDIGRYLLRYSNQFLAKAMRLPSHPATGETQPGSTLSDQSVPYRCPGYRPQFGRDRASAESRYVTDERSSNHDDTRDAARCSSNARRYPNRNFSGSGRGCANCGRLRKRWTLILIWCAAL